MGAWTDSLDTIYAHPQHLFNAALHDLCIALDEQGRGRTNLTLEASQAAAASIVAWRKSLPDQGEREPDRTNGVGFWTIKDRDLLRCAVMGLLYADAYADDDAPALQAGPLRRAEANLRTLWKRHQ